jgi:esterase/lipase superfamily enzyme
MQCGQLPGTGSGQTSRSFKKRRDDMRFAKHAHRLMCAIVALRLLSGTVIAQLEFPAKPKASLLDLTLTPAGSDDAPADRIGAVILIYPGTDRVDLELAAEAVDEAARRPIPATEGAQVLGNGAPIEPPAPQPIRAKDETHRGPDGLFRLTAIARGEKDAASVVKVLLAAPRSAIVLAPQGQLIRYTLRASVDGAAVFSTATQLIDPSGMVQTPPAAPAQDFSIEMPVEVLIPTADAVGRRADSPGGPMPSIKGGITSPPAPSKAIPTAQAPVAPSKTYPAAQAPAAPARTYPGPEAAAPMTQIPPAGSFIALQKRPVLFATNRNLRNVAGTPSERFGGAVDQRIRYGSCLVNIPVENHTEGKLELPSWYSRRDPNWYFLIDATAEMDFKQFRDIIAQKGSDTRRDVLVFIHGYNTSFDYAVMVLAQVTHDIQFSGLPLAFSWPSNGSVFRYDDDEANAANSVGAFTETLQTLIDVQLARPENLRGKIHVIAHSLGNRVTLRALQTLHGQLRAGYKPFGQVILAAPDVSVSEFALRLHAAQSRSDRVTLYFCPDDWALLASQIRHPNELRAGRGIVPITALDNIDAHKANTSFLAHGYWSSVKQLLIDMQMLVNLGWGPGQRVFTLEHEIAPPDYQYWRFR